VYNNNTGDQLIVGEQAMPAGVCYQLTVPGQPWCGVRQQRWASESSSHWASRAD